MAKVSRSAYRAFQANITVARGFIELHFIIEDLLEHGGQNTIGKMTGFVKRVMKVAGVSWDEIEELIRKPLTDVIEGKAQSIGKAKLERRAKELIEELTPQLESLFKTVESVSTAYERGLLEQALVVTVSALETYLFDITIEAVAKNRYLQKAFTSRLHEGFSYSDLVSAHGDVNVALGEVIANSYKFYDPQSVRKHLNTLLRGPSPFESKNTQNWFVNLLAYRNLIAHNAGIVDKEFKRKTGYKGKIGLPIHLNREFVGGYIKLAEELVDSIQIGLEKLHA